MEQSTQRETLMGLVAPILAPLGYEVVEIEAISGRQNVLRVFIDHLTPDKGAIGIEDCVRANHALDAPLEESPEIAALFKGRYELEVSSPGIERPLRRASDFERFSGSKARIEVLRPLSADELANEEHQRRNPKQKVFTGNLLGLKDSQTAACKIRVDLGRGETIEIPHALISKAKLEADWAPASERKRK